MAKSTATDMRSDLARARGIGAAKDGVAHWWAQRLTALALIPLALWFVGSIIGLVGASHSAALAWIGSPATAVLLIVLIAATFHHAQLGVQVVIEDYVHHEGLKVAAVVAVKSVAILLAVAAVLAVLKIAVKG